MVAALAIAVAVGGPIAGTVATARKKKPKPLLPPFDVTLVSPSSVVAGSGAPITVVATPTGTARKRKAVLQRIDATGRVLGTAAKLRDDGRAPDVAKRDGRLTGTVTLDDASPAVVLLRVKGPKKRPGSVPVAVLVTNDPAPLAALFPALYGPEPPSHRLETIDDPLASEFAAAIAQVLPPVDDRLLVLSSGPAASEAVRLRPLASPPEFRMGGATTNAAADTQVGKVLDELGMLGLDVTPLRSALGETQFHQEGPQVGGFMLDSSRGVNGLTVVSNAHPRAKLPTTDASGAAVMIIPANFTNHVILETANMTSLMNDPIVDATKGQLGAGASTAIHELVHSMVFEEGCYGANDNDEPFVDTVEGVINLQVSIGLKKKAGQPTTAEDADMACRIADLWESEPKGRPCLMKLGYSLPTGVSMSATGFLLFTSPVGGPATPSSQPASVTSTPSICARASIRVDRQFDMDIVPRKGGTTFAINVTAYPTLIDDEGNAVNLPPGNYTNFIEVTSPSALVSPVLVTVGLTVTAPGRAVRLGAALGTQAAGSEVCLANIQGGCVNPAHDPICAYVHLHGGDGITITGVSGGPFPDPAAMGCGYGEVISKPACGPDTLPACN
jgi:hypothetical protein